MLRRRIKAALGGLLLLSGSAQAGVIFTDNFDPINSSQWTLTSDVGARGAGQQGFDFGNALHFRGNGTRSATTVQMDVSNGAVVQFDFRGGNEDIDGSFFWEDVDFGEDAVLEYSTDGVNFTPLDTLDLVQFRDDSPTTEWLSYSTGLPADARSSTTSFRWRQLNHSGTPWDKWAIDNVTITATPEPGTWGLVAVVGMLGMLVYRRRPGLEELVGPS